LRWFDVIPNEGLILNRKSQARAIPSLGKGRKGFQRWLNIVVILSEERRFFFNGPIADPLLAAGEPVTFP